MNDPAAPTPPPHPGVNIANTPSPHSTKQKLARTLWGAVYALVFRNTPRPMHALRRSILRLFGAKLAPGTKVLPRARVWAPWNLVMHENATIADDVDVYAVDRIEIGANTTVSQYSYLCGATHDHTHPRFPLVPRPITIGASCWIAADCYVAPGVAVGEGVVVGARSSVFADLPPWTICVGSPAKPVKERTLGEATPHENLPRGERPGDDPREAAPSNTQPDRP